MKDDSVLFLGQFRSTSARCPRWEYASVGWYLVTICTQGRRHWFGEIRNGRMCVSAIGSIVWQCWEAIPHHHPHGTLDRCIVMPDHMHGIVHIIGSSSASGNASFIERHSSCDVVETPHGASLRCAKNDLHWKKGVLGVIVNQFKGACTTHIRPHCSTFAWQSRFHDRIIRDNDALESMRRYLDDNPMQWERDSGRT